MLKLCAIFLSEIVSGACEKRTCTTAQGDLAFEEVLTLVAPGCVTNHSTRHLRLDFVVVSTKIYS